MSGAGLKTTSGLDLHDEAGIEDYDRMLRDYSDGIVKNGPFAQGDTQFAIGHYTDGRLVWFDILTVTMDDIMRECAFPEEQREQHRLRNQWFAKYFLRHHTGPEKTLPLLEE